MENILVTGGTGFIGSHLVNKLVSLNKNVTVVDNLSFGRNKPNPAAKFIETDINYTKDIFAEGKFDTVYHLAAVSGAQLSYDAPEKDIHTNILGTFNLLKYATEFGVKKFVNTSSVAVYGDPKMREPIHETAPCLPISQYGVSKLASEFYCKMFPIKTCSLRLFNVYGPGQDVNNAKQGIVSIYMYYIIKNEPIITKGSLDRIRDLIYIDDVIDAYIAAEYLEGTYNVCSGVPTTVGDLQQKIIKAMGKSDYPVNVVDERTPGDPFGFVGFFAKLAAECRRKGIADWVPKIDLDTGLEKMTRWINESNRTS